MKPMSLKLKQTGLALTLMCLASLAFGAEIVVSSALTGVQSIAPPQSVLAPGKISLNLPPRAVVTFPAPFDVSAEAFSMCVSTERDGPDLFVSASELGLNKTAINEMNCEMKNNVFLNLDLGLDSNQSGKIITLLLAPE